MQNIKIWQCRGDITTSSSSSSEDESEAKPKPATTSAKITAAETKTVLPVKSLSPVEAKKSSSTSSLTSSSSDSESDSQADKLVPKPVQSVKPPSPVEAKKPSPSTSSVTSSSSDSESSSEADKPVPKPRTPSPELKRPEPQRATAPHAARESSGSSSDSDSSSEADKPVPKPRTPSPELKKPATPMAAAPHAARESSGSSSDSDSSSSLSDSEDKSPVKQDVVKQEESQQSSPKLEKKPFEMRGGGIAQQRDREETEDSSTDSSSSSDSESDSEEKAKPKTATDESDHNYGGHDPDNVAQSSGSKDGSLGLTSVPAPKAHFGSILPMVEGDTALELSGVKLTDSQVAELSNFITKNHDLKSVTLRNSALEDTSFLSLARALQMSPSNPSIVNLGLNNLGPDSMTAFANVIKNKPAMEVIILNGNPLGDVGCKLLCDALIKTKDPFPFLRRTSGYLSPAEARQQKDQGKEVKYDSHNDEGCNLKQLDLSETKIGDAGIGEISRFLDSNKTLTSLSLNGNTAVTASGWERLGQAMKKNTTLKSMSIDHAGIGDTGLEGLVKGLRVNVGLRSLELEHAGLTEKGGLILRDLVKGNTSIVDLSITRGNDISENMVEEIRKYLALNRSMLS
ncbi:uncharacterized protein LOC127856846 [Dreissena polymorpha]|uniref:RNI-like protein n=1 Tax=Dreissena polymorpha TaxID=45954 RepID=A0A9D4BXX4_DREPO|nr:uncharacterized protein LOC127856846 [Dreissena polymorpha]KAH3713028.1 hypothetical protein DPMN_072792 [Dreissena polymorpha]